jgi:hypothetical protein
MKQRFSAAVTGCVVAMALAGAAHAAPSQVKYTLNTWVYDPGNTGAAASEWQAGAGLPDGGKGDQSFGLYLQKNVPTSTEAAGGAEITGVSGVRLTELGFDFRNDGWCGAGAPRFNIYTDAGTYYFFGCYYGNHTAVNANWTRVRFRDQDAYPAYATQSPWPGFGTARVYRVTVVFDEGTEVGPGFSVLDNIDVAGTLISKPSK